MVKTSKTDPLYINVINIPKGGSIGMTLCPGKSAPRGAGGWWARDLSADIKSIACWGATAVLSLLEEDEYTELGVPWKEMAYLLTQQNIRQFSLPMKNDRVPIKHELFAPLYTGRANAYRHLAPNHKLLVFCNGGVGRTGMVVGKILVDIGWTPKEAVAEVKTVRPGALMNNEQCNWVLNLNKKNTLAERWHNFIGTYQGHDNAY